MIYSYDDIRHAITNAIESGKIGQPVSIRIHLQRADNEQTPSSLIEILLTLVESAIGSRPATLMAQSEDSARQLSLLFQYHSGQTAFLTAGAGQANQPSFHLVLVGNHGIVCLQGTDVLEIVESSQPENRPAILPLIEQSLSQSAAVSL
jgi:hypothetical protein